MDEMPDMSAHRDGDTIVALSSGQGRAGIAVIRISGAGSREAVENLAGPVAPPRRASLRRLRNASGETLDRALVLWLPGPGSFSGEDMAELHVHGGRAVVESVIAALLALPDTRLAEAGDFTRRAFENGRLDLTAVEGLADLIDADTEAQRRQAVAQADGALAALYDGWRDSILRAQARIEAMLDFSDEADVPADVEYGLDAEIEALRNAIGRHLEDGRRGEILRDGFRAVIAGPPNAGKSTLLNTLAGRDAAIVADEPGTTRDLIDVRLDLGGYPVIVTDTAGLRGGTSAVEAEGVRRALARAEDADLVIWLTDATMDAAPPPPALASHPNMISVRNKSDIARGAARDGIAVSARTSHGVNGLIEILSVQARTALRPGDGPALTRARHRHALDAASAALTRFLSEKDAAPEMRAEELRLAATQIGRVTGRIDVEDVLGEIFVRFCIGK